MIVWWLPLAGLAIAALLLWLGRRRIDGITKVGLSHFVVFLLPMLGLIDYGNLALTFVSDHYLYVPSIGFFLAAAHLLHRARIRWPGLRAVITGTVVVAAAIAAAITVVTIPVFRNGETMWRRTLDGHPDCTAALIGLGRVHEERDEWENALVRYRRAAELLPAEPRAQLDVARALAALKRYQPAMVLLQGLRETHPHLAAPLFEAARVAERQGRVTVSIDLYEQGLRREPRNVRAHIELGAVQLEMLARTRAAAHFRRAIEIRPDDPRGYVGLATSLNGQNRVEEAIDVLHQGLTLLPDHVALLNFQARILATTPNDRVRDGRGAVRLAEAAARAVGHDDYQVLDTLSAAYAEAGRWAEAVETARLAIDRARSAGDDRFVRIMQGRLNRYGRGEPLREVHAVGVGGH